MNGSSSWLRPVGSWLDLHVNHETVQPIPRCTASCRCRIPPTARSGACRRWRAKKRPATGKNIDDQDGQSSTTRKSLIAGIPEAAEQYMLGSRSALAWIIDRYQVKNRKASGIVNDPNDWCDEHDEPTTSST